MKNTKLLLILFVLLISVLSITGLIIGLQNRNTASLRTGAQEIYDTPKLTVGSQNGIPSGMRFLADCGYIECQNQTGTPCKCYGTGEAVPTAYPTGSANPKTPTPMQPSPCANGACKVTNLSCSGVNAENRYTMTWTPVQNAVNYAVRVYHVDGEPGESFGCNIDRDICADLPTNAYFYNFTNRRRDALSYYKVWIHAINNDGIWSEATAVDCSTPLPTILPTAWPTFPR